VSRRPPLPGGPYLIVGLGRSGIAAGLALAARGETVVGVDGGRPDVAALGDIPTHLETDGVNLLEGVGTLVKSPGVPGSAAVVSAARDQGVHVIGELELAWRLLENDFIAVTGTNGKTTTVELIGQIHREAGLDVAVAGNVGLALSTLLESGRIASAATIVCEASSFQLEDTIDFAPDAAVLLNLSDDHLDRHGTAAAYRAAKLEIFARQTAGDVAVAPQGLEMSGGAARRVRFGSGADAELADRDGSLWWRGTRLLGVDEIRLRGRHNRLNAMAAAAVTLARGLPIDAVRAGLAEFAGVPHRLEDVASVDGVLYVNDSKATNVAGTLVALDSFPPGSVHLVLGGQAKGQSFEPLRAPVAQRCAGVYLIGEDAPLIAAALGSLPTPTPTPTSTSTSTPTPTSTPTEVRHSESLERAFSEARAAARAGQVVLLSPACASFDQFTDFEHRGQRFRELVDVVARGREAQLRRTTLARGTSDRPAP
jgi:UDP-N-acetylmuramoylalanine--D-glutamate ligase